MKTEKVFNQKPTEQKRRQFICVTVGMTFFWVLFRYDYIFYRFSDVQHTGLSAYDCYLISIIGILVCCLLSLLFCNKFTLGSQRHKTLLLLLSLVSLSLDLTVFVPIYHELTLTIIVVLRAVFFALLFFSLIILWGVAVSRSFDRVILIGLVISFLSSFCLSLLEVIPGFISDVLAVIAPFCSLAFVLQCPKDQEGTLGLSDTLRRMDLPLVAMLIAFVLIGSFVRGALFFNNAGQVSFGDSITLTSHLISIALSALFLVVVIHIDQVRRVLYAAWAFVAIICFVGLFLIAISRDMRSLLGGHIALVARTFFVFLFYVLLTRGTKRSSLRTTETILVGFVVIEATSSLLTYWIFPSFLLSLGVETQDLVVGIALGVALIMIAVAFFHFANLPLRQTQLSPKETAQKEKVLRDIALQYGLTNKEQEILFLLYRGNTYKRIGEVLHISPNTVLSHVRNIYKKLSVHSKQDLIDMVNDSEEF